LTNINTRGCNVNGEGNFEKEYVGQIYYCQVDQSIFLILMN